MPKQPSKDKILPSELRILKLLWEDKYIKEIANKLCISVKTLYTELRNARKRNKLKTTSALLRFAVENGKLL
jgi:DNA-binding CsgD family transcriptional regulator